MEPQVDRRQRRRQRPAGTALPLHLRHGVHAPTAGTPPRRPVSIRRTSTIDAIRPGRLEERITLLGRVRDLITMPGRAYVIAAATSRIEIEFTGDGPRVTAIKFSPVLAGAQALVGRRAGAGFRRAVDELAVAHPGSGEYLLLDEVPVCTLVSFYAVMHAVERGDQAGFDPVLEPPLHAGEACAGFMRGGTIQAAMAVGQRAIATGPAAPSVLPSDDPLAWHKLPTDLSANRMRRWRRTDVWRDEHGDWQLDSFYRDSHTTPDGYETVIHEYTIDAAIDHRTRTVADCSCNARVLPFVECLPAAASAQRIRGRRIELLRQDVRRELTGVTTCTHLNDQLRGLADVDYLVHQMSVPPDFDAGPGASI